MSRLGSIGKSTVRVVTSVRDLSTREKQRLLNEFGQVRGLMPLLMKPRNKQKWTREEREELTSHLKRLSSLSPYLVVLVMPGGLLALPALAWWLDRRRVRARAPAAGA